MSSPAFRAAESNTAAPRVVKAPTRDSQRGYRAGTPGQYFPHIDGLRALAVLAVMLYHLAPHLLPGGFVGVDVFFVISGYVVTASLAGHRHESAWAFLGHFYARRMARLVPALVVVLVTTTALYVLFVPQAWFNRAAETVGQMAFFGLSNWTLDRHTVNYFEPGAEWNPFTHTWSLGVEEQFYVIVPLLLFVALGERFAIRHQQRATAGIALLAAASLVVCGYVAVTHGPRAVFYQLVFRFWELGAGVLLYLLTSAQPRLAERLRGWHPHAVWIGLALVAVAMALPRPSAYPWARSGLAVLGTALLIGVPDGTPDSVVHRLLASRPALWIGLRSYGLYLWHWPIYVLGRWTTGVSSFPFQALAVALTFLLAAASYRWLEHPVRRSQTLRSWPVGARLVLFGTLVAAGWLTGHALLGSREALSLSVTARHFPDWYAAGNLLATVRQAERTCPVERREAPLAGLAGGFTSFIPRSCAWASKAQLFVLGDSHAAAYLPMLEQLSAEQGRAVHALRAPGCAYLGLRRPMRDNRRCLKIAHAAQRAVLSMGRAGDIVFLPSLRVPRLVYLGGARRAELVPSVAKDIYQYSPEELHRLREAQEEGPSWFVPFTESGLTVVFELPTPVFRVHAFQCVDWFNRFNPLCKPGLRERRREQERFRSHVVSVLRQWAVRHEGVQLWDPIAAVCDGSACSALHKGRPLFFDGDHLAPYGNLVLLPVFARMLNGLDQTRVASRSDGPAM